MSIFNISKLHRFDYVAPNIHPEGLVHPRRSMPVHDFLYCARGEWEIYVNGCPYRIYPDDVLIINAGTLHYGKEPCLPDTKVYFLHFFPVEGEKFSREYTGCTDPDFVEISPIVHTQNCPEIKKLFKEMISIFWSGDPKRFTKCSVMFQYLIQRLSEISEYGSENNILDKCISLMALSSNRFITPAEMAEKLYVSERTLRNLFKNKYGVTPYRYQHEMKLKHGANMMNEFPEMSIRQIAESLGYFDESHFIRCFTEYFGTTPGAYRQQNKTKDTIDGVSFVPITLDDVPPDERNL